VGGNAPFNVKLPLRERVIVIVNSKLPYPIASVLLLCFAAVFSVSAVDLGPIYDSFPLTLVPGKRTEILGPIISTEKTTNDWGWTFSPLMSYRYNPGVDSTSFDFVYPIVSHRRYGSEYRFQIFQIFSFSGGNNQKQETKKRFTLFPFYFQQRAPDPKDNYTAFLPFYGTLKNRLFRDRIHFVMMPIYVRTEKRGVITDNYLLPFFDVRNGAGVKGWQFWPVTGTEHKEITTSTNGFGDVETIGGYDKFFALWPFYFNNTTGIGTTNTETQRVILPIYVKLRSPARDTTAYGFPIGFTKIVNREQNYKEWGAPWPLVDVARGEGKHVNRVWPFFSFGKSPTLESDFVLWPLYKYNRVTAEPLDRSRMRIMFFLYSDVIEKNTARNTAKHRTDLWPFFTARREHDGNERLQIFAPLEPIVPENTSFERLYSPIWSIWRSEKNGKTGDYSESFLWNLYRRDETKTEKKVTFLFGLFQYRADENGKHVRLFYIPVK
jgi:hypothetical protein